MTGPTRRQIMQMADEVGITDYNAAARLVRLALAAFRPAPAPVPVSERLPEPEDCDGEGRCWVHQPHEACPESPAWELMLAKYASPNYGATCWLPATAIPLPAGEVQP